MIFPLTLWLFNIAMENVPFIAYLRLMIYLLKFVIFHSYTQFLKDGSLSEYPDG
jgi:hypothetical protein